MSQKVTEPTRESNILDIVLTITPDLITTSVHDGMSDHQIVILNLDMKAKIVKKKTRKVFIHGKADLQRIKEDITMEWEDFRKSNPGNNSVERNWLKFKNLLHSVMQKWIPQRTINKKWNLPWITPAIRRMIRKKQRCYNKARKSKEDEHWRDFRNMRQMRKKVIENAHNNYVTGLLDFNEKSNRYSIGKKFWLHVKNQRKDNLGIISLRNEDDNLVSTGKEKVHILNKHFQSVFTDEDLSNMPSPANSDIPDMPKFVIHTEGVEKLLKNINVKKANGPDEISSWVLKETATKIAPFLQFIFMQSIKEGEIPRDRKIANVGSNTQER